MKKPALLTLAIIALSSSMMATTINSNCVVYPVAFQNGAGSTVVSCPGTGVQPVGSVLNSVVVNYAADYQFGSSTVNPNIVKVTFSPIGPAGATFNLASTDVFVSGNQSSGALGVGSAVANSGVTLNNFLGGFTVNVSSTVVQGTVYQSSGAVSVSYDITDTTVPEPSTFALLGGALVGLGLLRRRVS